MFAQTNSCINLPPLSLKTFLIWLYDFDIATFFYFYFLDFFLGSVDDDDVMMGLYFKYRFLAVS